MAAAGFEVIPVPVYYPDVTEILGKPVFRKLGEIGKPIDMVNVFRRLEHIPEIVEQAIRAGARGVWTQYGLVDARAAERARAAGLQVVMDRCLMVEHARHS